MNEPLRLRFDIELPARKLSAMILSEDKVIEQQIKEGVQLALDQLGDGKTVVEFVRDRVLQTTFDLIQNNLMNYNFQKKVYDMIEDGIRQRIQEHGYAIAEQIISKINNPNSPAN